MRLSLHIALYAGAFLVCAVRGQAAEALSLQQAIQQAVAGSPILKSAAERVASFQGSVVQAGLKPNPRLVVQQENFRSWDFNHQEPGQPPGFVYLRDTDTYVYGAQIVERGHKRQRRVDFASSVRDRASLERDLLEQQIRARVAAAYWAALSAAKIRDLYRADSDTFGRIVDDQRNRVREGAAPGADLLRMQVEQRRLRAAFQSAAADANRARIGLLREMGRSEFPELDLTESLENLPRISLKDFSHIVLQRRDARMARHSVLQAEANARLQRANGKVDPEIQFGYKRTAGFDTLYTALNVPVALHNRNQGNIASADADIRTAQESLAAVDRQIRAEVESARADYEAKQRIVSDTLRPLLTDAQRSLEITEGAYREGGFDLLRYLDAQRARIEAQTLYYRGLGELHQSAVAVEQAQGDFQ